MYLNVIGNKVSFAIEYVLADSVELMGCARFWFSDIGCGGLAVSIVMAGEYSHLDACSR